MIAINELEARTLELSVLGKVSQSDVEALENALSPYLADEGSVDVVIDITKADGTTLYGVLEDAKLEGRLMAQLEKFGRLALVTKSDTQGAVVTAFDTVMPPGEFKRFNPGELDQARAFVTPA